MHGEVTKFCLSVKSKYPQFFILSDVLDVGSMDINGTNKSLFTDCNYTGIDLLEGKNVDKVCACHEMMGEFDTIISTEAFEHDMYLRKSMCNIMDMLKTGGLFLFTCATTGRQEHGTVNHLPQDSASSKIEGWEDYYHNVTLSEIIDIIEPYMFIYEFKTVGTDLQFWGIKK